MKQTIEQKLLVPEGAQDIRVAVSGKTEITITYELEMEPIKEVKTRNEKIDSKFTKEYLDKYFPIVRASELSLEDDFLQYEPKTKEQREFKERLINAIDSGLSDFRAPVIDPFVDKNGDICYEAGKKSAVGRTAKWWFENAKKFMPEKNSRLGLTSEYIAFLALRIKFLMKEWGYSKHRAWKAVCDDSKDYWNSQDVKNKFETTGSRKVGEHRDLENRFKIAADDLQGSRFSLVGDHYHKSSGNFPLSEVYDLDIPKIYYSISVGWLVLDV